MKKLLFIYNPNTGGGRLKNRLMEVLGIMSEAGYRLTVYPTAARGDARRAAEEMCMEHDHVVCCGGDGTLNEVVHGLMQHRSPPPLGYIPGGTTNDFASSLKLPRTNMQAAAKRAVHPNRVFRCDVGRFNERIFNYVAAFGAFTDVAYATPQKFKNVLGYFAYVIGGISRLPGLQPVHIHLQADDAEYEDDFIFGMVSNSTSVGGFSFADKNKVKMDDGEFEILLVRQPHNLADLGFLSGALLARDATSPLLVATRASKIKFTGPAAVPWTLDGEYGGAPEMLEIDVLHRALSICV